MPKTVLRNLTFFTLFIISVCLLLCSCKSGDQKGKFSYYYFPQKNLYYDIQSRLFFYSLDGGKTWMNTVNKTANEPVILGEKVQLSSNEKLIYKYNDEHRKLYKGILYNFNNDNAAANGGSISERKTLASKRGSPNSGKEKPKKGIGGFFQKLFGKKKDR